MVRVEMSSSRPMWFNTKYFSLGLLFGGGLVFVILHNIPENFGLRSEQEVIIMQQANKNISVKYERCMSDRNDINSKYEEMTKKERSATDLLKACESAKSSLEQEKQQMKEAIQTLTDKSNDYETQKTASEKKIAENEKYITDLNAQVAELKTSLQAEKDKAAAAQAQKPAEEAKKPKEEKQPAPPVTQK